MKRLVLLSALTAVLFSCDKNKQIEKRLPEQETAHKIDDDSIPRDVRDIHHLCCTHNDYSVIEKYHEITDKGVYDAMLVEYWDNIDNVKYKEIHWSDIKAIIDTLKCDEKYMSFEYFDLNPNPTNRTAEDIVLKLVDKFNNDTLTCYSIPFLRSIEQNNHIEPSQVIQFTKAIEKEKVKIVFKVKYTHSEKYYDISLDPTKKGIKKL